MSPALAKDNVLPLPPKGHGRTISADEITRLIESGETHAELDVLVTPDIARVLLKYNRPGETNRRLSPTYIRATVHAISHGVWINTGEPIIMSRQQILNDGQHRLEAVVSAGLPAIMDLRFGIDRSAFEATNTGRKRSAGDILGFMGVPNAVLTAATLRLVLAYEEGLPASLHRMANTTEIAQAHKRWPAVGEAATMCGVLPNVLKSTAVCATVFFGLQTANEATVYEFARVLRTGHGDADNPPHVLREWILHRGPAWSRQDRTLTLAHGIMAWNKYREGSRVTRLTWRPGTPFPSVNELTL